jgi:serine protease Do
MKSSPPIHSWKYHAVILMGAILVLVAGVFIRNSIIKKTEYSEATLLQALQTEVLQLKTSLKKNDLEAIADIVAAASQKAAGAVVSVTAMGSAAPPRPITTFNDYRPDKRQQAELGNSLMPGVSGLLLDATGEILTTSAIAATAKEFQILFADGTKRTAQLIGVNTPEHLALLRLQQNENLPPVPERSAGKPTETGAWLIRLGRTPAGRQSVALGWLEAIRRDAVGREAYFLDAEFTPELDGGPTINLDGQLVGINVFRRDLGKGIMIPLEHAIMVAQTIKGDAQTAPQSWIGIEWQDLGEAMKESLSVSQGALITQVAANSPAQKAGLRAMDIIVQAAGKEIRTARELSAAIQQIPASTKLRLTLRRAGTTQEVEVETASFEGASAPQLPTVGFGLELAQTSSPQGVEIRAVRPLSAAAQLGLQSGDFIQAINGTALRSASELQQQQRVLPPQAPQLWLIRRGEQSFYLTLKEGVKAL